MRTSKRNPDYVAGLDEDGALQNFERMEHKVDEQAARAAALGELESNSVDQRFAQLATGEQVERELAALKAKKELAAPARPWPPTSGSPPRA